MDIFIQHYNKIYMCCLLKVAYNVELEITLKDFCILLD